MRTLLSALASITLCGAIYYGAAAAQPGSPVQVGFLAGALAGLTPVLILAAARAERPRR